jgi:hypothetical protein
MMNPFGNDDDDFDVNSMIDIGLQTSYIIVDEMHAAHPELLKDRYWSEIPRELPDLGRSFSDIKPNAYYGDIFNVDEFGSRKNVSVEINGGVENSSSVESLKPRSDVIDENYKRIENAQPSQTSLEKEMERIRNNLMLQDYDENEDDEEE